MRSLSDLHAYQHKAIDFIKSEKRCLLALSMGLGKSVSTLTAIADLSDSFTIHKTLVIAPLRVANSVWKQEAAQWGQTKHLKVVICTGSERERMSALMQSADVYVINRENVEWLIGYMKKWTFDCVVVDESDSFKNPGSKRFKALKKTIPYTNYFILLSGTPCPLGLLDLWSQMYLIDFGERLGRTMSSYKQRFFEQDYSGYRFTLREGAADKIHALLADKVLSMRAEDYLELPDRIDLIEKVQLPNKVMREYLEFEKNLLMQLPKDIEVEAITAAALANKLLQFSNGAMYHDEHHNYSELHEVKLNALGEIIEANSGENILVAYNYKHDLERLQKKFPDGVMLDKAPATIDKWNNGQIKLLFAHPASAGHGINLQGGGCISVWFGLNWSLGLYQQFNARLHRQGQGRPVRIIHIVVEGCIDERVLSVLSDKNAVQKNLLDALKLKPSLS
jgi:SNF2 family DNA or RNA helicase